MKDVLFKVLRVELFAIMTSIKVIICCCADTSPAAINTMSPFIVFAIIFHALELKNNVDDQVRSKRCEDLRVHRTPSFTQKKMEMMRTTTLQNMIMCGRCGRDIHISPRFHNILRLIAITRGKQNIIA